MELGWRAQLKLGFAAAGNKTVISEQRHFGPLMVQKPFYPEGPGVCHCYLIHPPGGVVGGDRLGVEVGVGPGAHGMVTTPAATKFYRSAGPQAAQINRLRVAAQGTLEWLPLETIVYDQAHVKSHTIVSLEKGAGFIGGEMICLGLPASRQPYVSGRLDQRLTVELDGRPLLIESLYIDGEDRMIEENWGLAGRPVTGAMVATVSENGVVDAVRQRVGQGGPGDYFGVTRIDSLVVCRFLGMHAWEGFKTFQKAWDVLRPAVTGRPACAPRIWAT